MRVLSSAQVLMAVFSSCLQQKKKSTKTQEIHRTPIDNANIVWLCQRHFLKNQYACYMHLVF